MYHMYNMYNMTKGFPEFCSEMLVYFLCCVLITQKTSKMERRHSESKFMDLVQQILQISALTWKENFSVAHSFGTKKL
jgi:hypothetical protein